MAHCYLSAERIGSESLGGHRRHCTFDRDPKKTIPKERGNNPKTFAGRLRSHMIAASAAP
jgi:hypothetical protein